MKMSWIGRISSVLAGGALAVLVGITIASVVMRYVFASPIFWLEEISGLLMIWIVMLGAIVTERDGQHLSIPLLVDLFPAKLRIALDLVVSLLSVAVLFYMIYLGVGLSLMARTKLTSILQMSWFWIDIAVPVGAAGLALFMIRQCLRDIAHLAGGDAK